MADLLAKQYTSVQVLPGYKFTVVCDAAGSALVERFVGDELQDKTAISASQSVTFGVYATFETFRVTCFTGTTSYSQSQSKDHIGKTVTVEGEVEISKDYSQTGHSYQPISADFNLTADAGSNLGTDPKFLAAVMGNVISDTMTGVGNYLAGVIGAYSVTGTNATEYPSAGVIGVVMDAAVDVDACVLAVIDGDDPSDATRARAAFGVVVLNNNAGSGVDYGLDLHAVPSVNYTPTAQGLNIAKAVLRSPNEVCYLEGDGVPTDGVAGTGLNFAGKGSWYTDYTNANIYINAGTKSSPTWKLITRAA